jgi:hypothetical protein
MPATAEVLVDRHEDVFCPSAPPCDHFVWRIALPHEVSLVLRQSTDYMDDRQFN